MPVLDHEPSAWPLDLFESEATAGDAGRWCVYHVRPRSEKVVARRLRSRGIAHFLPQYERRKRYQRRLVCSYLPLFPGYIFVVGRGGEPEETGELKELVGILKVDDQLQIESELRNIHFLLRAGLPVTREERLQPGALAKIISGPLAGLRGQVIKNQHGLKFVLRVQFLQQGVSVEVDGSMIEAL
jgi:transcription termination/antitermination protein NusG